MPAPTDPADRLVAGRYRLQAELGSGSTGLVWAAYDEVLHRRVAVKEVRLPPGTPEREARELHERTLREARAIAALSHPNVITIYDVALVDALPYVVMELVSGRSLGALLATRGALDLTQSAVVADALAAALQAAHRAGITHRDVKPGNVLIGEDGHVKLTDFGIARNMAESTMTRTGIILGSPAFMAPEMAAGREVGPACDLWSMGATLFATVEGTAPYDIAGDPLATINEVVHGQVPQAASAGPLAPVIAGLMCKDPERRLEPAQIRRLIYWLLPEPGTPVFDPAELAPTADVAAAALPARSVATTTALGEPSPQQPVAPLATDPGPLPFTLPEPRPRRRSRTTTVVLVAVAIVLFAAAAGTGFALSRRLAGAPLVPPPAAPPTTTSATPTPTLGKLHRVSGTAIAMPGSNSARYRVLLPRGWTSFIEQRHTSMALNATMVHYVSPDGRLQLEIRWLPGFYPAESIDTYLALQSHEWGQQARTVVSDQPVPGLGREAREVARQVQYRTVESGGEDGSDLGRTTFAELLPDGDNLWVVAVTVPTDQEDSGSADLFSRIAPSFAPAGG